MSIPPKTCILQCNEKIHQHKTGYQSARERVLRVNQYIYRNQKKRQHQWQAQIGAQLPLQLYCIILQIPASRFQIMLTSKSLLKIIPFLTSDIKYFLSEIAKTGYNARYIRLLLCRSQCQVALLIKIIDQII